uniref:SnoaL-like domain-containing protein n=1 Tax=Panagrellus redivivus TaxID=6233 RepID=A0A7E4ZRN8_PANRE
MVSQKEIDEIIEKIESDYSVDLEAGNYDKVAEYYHPDAALVHAGNNGFVGRKAIGKTLAAFAQNDKNFKATLVRNIIAGTDAEFVIHEGTYTSDSLKGKQLPYRQIFKKENGKYLIYHDEFTF